ncbi:type II toxin-antitoxin system VapC family toxin [Sphingomonas sp. 2SG]|jgi:ribonuclease VapC|uniref:type II toxin-antitoxin system VapC family toxin n=1 Tax=Sphingomonas sp. 2SG TaxID=2502201 RepID=UPI0010F51757|nr:type II toxin-antitoxin system VapC family toxin [Sphingomonas sp. 2SG]
MIVADTSAFAAIILNEPDAMVYAEALRDSATIIVSAPTILELRSVLYRRFGADYMLRADTLLAAPSIQVVPWTEAHLPIAVDALQRFGGRPARLNFGDCMVYAIAKALDAPLLYKGEDFARTDIRSAL